MKRKLAALVMAGGNGILSGSLRRRRGGGQHKRKHLSVHGGHIIRIIC